MSDAADTAKKEEAPASAPVRLSEMLWTVNDEAERIENVQAARVKCGEAANAEMVRRAEIFRAIGRFFFTIEPIMPEIRAMLTRPKKGRR